MSVKKKWDLFPKYSPEFAQKVGLKSEVLLQLLSNKQLTTSEEVKNFLHPDFKRDLGDPFLFVQMEKVVARIKRALDQQESVLVYGDYDTDGVSSATLLVTALQELGLKQVEVYLPDRETEGYGLNLKSIENILTEDFQLLITVDCGSSNVEEVAFLNQKGVDVLIFDHHSEPASIPQATGIINPKFVESGYPFKDFAAVGVVFKVLQALVIKGLLNESWLKWQLDLVALATVADMMPLVGENRTLVYYGLIVMNQTKRLGLRLLAESAGIEIGSITANDIGFALSPRINAAGRIKHASAAYDLLQVKEISTGKVFANDLNETNALRKKITHKIFLEVMAQVEEQSAAKVVIAVQPPGSDLWPIGVVGLVAGRVMNKLHKPTFVISHHEKGFVGSGRSLPQLNVMLALKSRPDLFVNFGGHPQACGFTIESLEKVEQFKKVLIDFAEQNLTDDDLIETFKVAGQLNFSQVNWKFWDDLQLIAPYGQANPAPIWLFKKVKVGYKDYLGRTDLHLKLKLWQDNLVFETLAFNMATQMKEVAVGDDLDILVEVQLNEWQGSRQLQFRLIDFVCHR